MTLTEFLLERIAEDEEMARIDSNDQIPWNCWPPERILVECEAKRRIIDLHNKQHECVGYLYGEVRTVLVAEGYLYENCPTLLPLALPYTDHQDYDEEWRP